MTTIYLENDEAIRKVKIHDSKPSFYMIGKGTVNHKMGMKSIDLLQAVGEMTSNEKFAFFEIKNGIEWDIYDKKYIYAVKVYSRDYSQTQKNMFSRGYKLLHEKDIVRRVKRGTYMINPSALIPKNFDEEWKVWNKLDSTSEGKQPLAAT